MIAGATITAVLPEVECEFCTNKAVALVEWPAKEERRPETRCLACLVTVLGKIFSQAEQKLITVDASGRWD